jgi:hypothetical protein
VCGWPCVDTVALLSTPQCNGPAAAAQAGFAVLLGHAHGAAAEAVGAACGGAEATLLCDLLAGELLPQCAGGRGPCRPMRNCNAARSKLAVTALGLLPCAGAWQEGLLALLAASLAGHEAREAALRHTGALRGLVRLLPGEGHSCASSAAAAVLRRMSAADAGRVVVTRHLLQVCATGLACAQGHGYPQTPMVGKRTCGLLEGRLLRPQALSSADAGVQPGNAPLLLCLAEALRPAERAGGHSKHCEEAAALVGAGGCLPAVLAAAHSPDAQLRCAGLAVLHALATGGGSELRCALGRSGGVEALVDAVRMERSGTPVPMPPPWSDMGEAAAEALAALAAASEAQLRDVAQQVGWQPAGGP